MSHVTWLIAGLVFCALELVLPGGVSGALGLATLMIALLIFLGYLTTFPLAFGLWLVLSTLFLLIVRKIMRRLSPNRTSIGQADHDETLLGTTVSVTETIPAGGSGRITVAGTSWIAILDDAEASASAGTRVVLISKSNITWLVGLVPQVNAGEIS